MFEKYQVSKPKDIDEQYLLVINDFEINDAFYLLIPGRIEFAELLNSLPKDRYSIVQIHLLSNVKNYKEFIKELREESKPDGLSFG